MLYFHYLNLVLMLNVKQFVINQDNLLILQNIIFLIHPYNHQDVYKRVEFVELLMDELSVQNDQYHLHKHQIIHKDPKQ